jgi:hypothetical protein
MRLSESDAGVGLMMKNCPACYSKLPGTMSCCGFVWSKPDQIKPNIKLDFMAKESDPKNVRDNLTHIFLPKLSPSSWWAFLFAKNK